MQSGFAGNFFAKDLIFSTLNRSLRWSVTSTAALSAFVLSLRLFSFSFSSRIDVMI